VDFTGSGEFVGRVVDMLGVAAIVVGIVPAGVRPLRRRRAVDGYRALRRDLGRGILLGLEILVAGDIIRTVGISPSFESVGVLGMGVLIRTFLSLSLELEIEGRVPWRRSAAGADAPTDDHDNATARASRES